MSIEDFLLDITDKALLSDSVQGRVGALDQTTRGIVENDVPSNKYSGIYRGIVKDNQDISQSKDNPNRAEYSKTGRIRVYVPSVYGPEDHVNVSSLPWAKPCFLGYTHMNPDEDESQEGIFWVPPINSSVWVMFENGDPAFPVWLGGAPYYDPKLSIPDSVQFSERELELIDEDRIQQGRNPEDYRTIRFTPKQQIQSIRKGSLTIKVGDKLSLVMDEASEAIYLLHQDANPDAEPDDLVEKAVLLITKDFIQLRNKNIVLRADEIIHMEAHDIQGLSERYIIFKADDTINFQGYLAACATDKALGFYRGDEFDI